VLSSKVRLVPTGFLNGGYTLLFSILINEKKEIRDVAVAGIL
jgi:hypothetical protein